MQDFEAWLRMVPVGTRSAFREADGEVLVHLPAWAPLFGEAVGDDPWWVPIDIGEAGEGPYTPNHVVAAERLLASQREAGEAIVAVLATVLPQITAHYGEWPDVAAMLAMPRPADVARLVRPTGVFFHDVDGEGLVGVAFDADWDNEHGLGFPLRGSTVHAVDTADAAFVAWMVRRAGERGLEGLYRL